MLDKNQTLPAPELFEAALLLCASGLRSFEHRRLCDDREGVEQAMRQLDARYGWKTEWKDTDRTRLGLAPLEGKTIEQTMALATRVTRACPGWCDRAARGVQPKITLLRKWVAECIADGVAVFQSAARGINAVGPIGSGAAGGVGQANF